MLWCCPDSRRAHREGTRLAEPRSAVPPTARLPAGSPVCAGDRGLGKADALVAGG